MEKKERKDFYEFCRIIEKLRAPGGCPWDREQTHASLAKHLIEEAYEAYDAIEEGNPEKIADELGDVLLQIVMHACIGEEEGTFTIDDVTTLVSEKMIVRHPHIFGNVKVSSSGEVLDNWEEIKKKERGQKSVYETMENVTKSLPSLTRAEKLIDKAQKAGLFTPCTSENTVTEEQIGERLFEICAIAQQNGIDAEAALRSETKNFIKKVKNIEENT